MLVNLTIQQYTYDRARGMLADTAKKKQKDAKRRFTKKPLCPHHYQAGETINQDWFTVI